MRFKTESGTVYVLDKSAMTCCRERTTKDSGGIRKDFGQLVAWPIVVVGCRAILQDKSVLADCTHHAVVTSVVTEVQGFNIPERE